MRPCVGDLGSRVRGIHSRNQTPRWMEQDGSRERAVRVLVGGWG